MSSPSAVSTIYADPDSDRSGTPVIGTLHLMLAATAMIAFVADPAAVRNLPRFAWAIFFGFAVHNIHLYVQAHRHEPASDNRVTLWLGVCWYSAMVYVTGGGHSVFFPFYLFTILISAFRFGFAESARITLASTGMFLLTALMVKGTAELVQVLLRSTFLLSLGYMIAIWGESNLSQRRGLALLRDVCQLDNPRFGIDRTIGSVMERSRIFFNADSCILVSHRPNSRRWELRIARPQGMVTEPLGAAVAPPLMNMPCGQMAMYASPLISWPGVGAFRLFDDTLKRWRDCVGDQGQHAAELLDARSFISVPLKFRHGHGRIFMTSSKRRFTEADATFLLQIVTQVLPVIENIHLLDRIASLAALRERRTIAHDLHDSTVQPYIGLSHSLSALRNKAGEDNPLKPDIDALSAMTEEVVGDLRRFAGGFARNELQIDQLMDGALRRYAHRAKQLYDIDIALDITGQAHIGDRLAAVVLQLSSEGISNMCKHTAARHGALRIACDSRWLRIEIENDSAAAPAAFTPRSIARRSNALGGNIKVEHRTPDSTTVRIDIPV